MRLGMVGLGRMGGNMTIRMIRFGHQVVAFDPNPEARERVGAVGAEPAERLEGLVAKLDSPRIVWIMVPAGEVTEQTLDHLMGLMSEGDVIIDGGNSNWKESIRHAERLKGKGITFLDCGTSGGIWGLANGYCLMVGGDRAAFDRTEPIFKALAPEGGYAYVGRSGAGHFVKMVHNGIEYADIQLIAETYDLLHNALGLSADELASVFREWNNGRLQSYLIEITSYVLAKHDDGARSSLVDAIEDEAEQKGTGRWTSQSALELGVPLTGITEAVFARMLSSQKAQRVRASNLLQGPGATKATSALIDDVQEALYASKIVAYAQGFEHLAAGSKEHRWNLDLGALATIWRGGCIIRAKFLDRIKEAYEETPDLPSLMLAPFFHKALADAQPAWRRVIKTAVDQGIPIPAFASSLAYYDGYRRARGPANLIQGLRDYFGAHTYHRTDREGAYHTRWAQDGEEIRTDS